MSRGFVKESDQEEVPMVPPRADLPNDVINYVTPFGINELLTEKQQLLAEKDGLSHSNENENRIAVNHIHAKLEMLENRIKTAKVIDLDQQVKDEVHFGATVTLKIDELKKNQKYQIVGADEANVSKGKISFISPIAALLINKKVNEKAVLKLQNEDKVFEIIKIEYL